MKILLYCSILLVILSAVAYAECSANSPSSKQLDLTERDKCVLIRPVDEITDDTLTGEAVTVSCTHEVKDNNHWEVDGPLKGARLTITGYNENDDAMEGASLMLNNDGTKDFTPQVAGTYLLQIGGCDPPYSATFKVAENPNKPVVVVKEVEEPDDLGPTAAVVAGTEATDASEPVAAEEEVVVDEPTDATALNFILEGDVEEDPEDASDFMVFLVGLILS